MSLLSICIPVYNGEKYIARCLEPLIKMNDVEIICVNDGSKDNSLAILKAYEQQSANIKVINQENQGQSAARNKAIEVASGKYLAFVDIDDWLDTLAATKLQEIALKYDPDLIQFGVISEFGTWSGKKELLYPESKLLSESEKQELYALICGYKDQRDIGSDYFGLVSCKFYKRAVVKDILFTSNIVGEDTLYACKAGQKTGSAYFLSEYFYHYTNNTDSYSHKLMPNIIPKSVRFLNETKAILAINDTTDELMKKAFYDRSFFMLKWCLQAMGFYQIKEKHYQQALISDIFNNAVYQDLLKHLDILYLTKEEMMLLLYLQKEFLH